jgi:hypothetical protein
VVAGDEGRRPQKMAIMNIVWPATCLYWSVLGLLAYLARGRSSAGDAAMDSGAMQGKRGFSAWEIALATSHCGAGCALSDVVAEFGVFGLGLTVAGSSLHASFVWDFALAWCVGVVFQYLTIKPMRHLSPAAAILAAMKADTLSITAFQVGMYGWMFVVHRYVDLKPDQALFWLSMQGAMVAGFATSFPMNWMLLKLGWKERMG